MFEWEREEEGLRRRGGRSTVEVVGWVLFPAPQAAQGNGNLRGFYHLISQLLAVTTMSAFSSLLFGKSSVPLLSCSWFIGCLREWGSRWSHHILFDCKGGRIKPSLGRNVSLI